MTDQPPTAGKPAFAPASRPRFIVAEISKSWPESPAEVLTTEAMRDPPRLLAQRFERAINHNWEQGYRLIDWKLSQIGDPAASMTEIIIAIFELNH